MRVKLKTLKNVVVDLDLPTDTSVQKIKEAGAASEHGKSEGWEPEGMKLIYQGKIMANDKDLASYNVTEDDFMVVMAAKAKKPAASEAPPAAAAAAAIAATTPSPEPAASPAPAPVPAPAAPAPAPSPAPALAPAPAPAPAPARTNRTNRADRADRADHADRATLTRSMHAFTHAKPEG